MKKQANGKFVVLLLTTKKNGDTLHFNDNIAYQRRQEGIVVLKYPHRIMFFVVLCIFASGIVFLPWQEVLGKPLEFASGSLNLIPQSKTPCPRNNPHCESPTSTDPPPPTKAPTPTDPPPPTKAPTPTDSRPPTKVSSPTNAPPNEDQNHNRWSTKTAQAGNGPRFPTLTGTFTPISVTSSDVGTVTTIPTNDIPPTVDTASAIPTTPTTPVSSAPTVSSFVWVTLVLVGVILVAALLIGKQDN